MVPPTHGGAFGVQSLFSPLLPLFEKQQLSLSWLLLFYLSLDPSQIPDHLPVMILILWYSHMLISRLEK